MRTIGIRVRSGIQRIGQRLWIVIPRLVTVMFTVRTESSVLGEHEETPVS